MTQGQPAATTPEERDLLRVLALRPNGGIVRGEDEKRMVFRMCHSGLISDVYDMPGGAVTARVTAAGKAELENYEGDVDGEVRPTEESRDGG